MNEVEIFQGADGTDWVFIDRGNGEFTTMSKLTYEEQQAALKTPMVIDEASTK
jgi:hypothetical protein